LLEITFDMTSNQQFFGQMLASSGDPEEGWITLPSGIRVKGFIDDLIDWWYSDTTTLQPSNKVKSLLA